MNRQDLAAHIFKVAHRTGEFKLRSGQISNEYFDKYRFEARPELLQAIAEHAEKLIPQGIDALAALEMGGIPIGTALSLKTGIPIVFVRKEAKDYGTCQFAEGLEIKGKKLLIIEDVITTGGQVVLSAEDLRKEGAEISQVLCVIDRSLGKKDKLHTAGLEVLPLFTMEELKAAGQKS